jgi:hypothetical protein
MKIYSDNDSSSIKYINLDSQRPKFKEIFSENIKIDSISPQKIYFFKKGSRLSKKVPVKMQFTYSIDNNFILIDDPKFLNNNDSVIIEGTKDMLEKINFVRTQKIDLGTISDSEPINIALETNPQINYSTTYVNVYFPLEKFTEQSCEIPIEAVNFPRNTTVTLIPQVVTITYKVPLSLYDKISPNNFVATVNYNKRNNENKIFINVISKNKAIIVSETLIPDYVRFIVEKDR